VNNSLIRSFGVPLEVKAYKEALVATKEIGIGKSINSSNVVLKKVEVDGNHHNLVSMDLLEGEDIVSIAPDGTKTFVKKLEPIK
jgi:hypothetical protein